MNLALFNKYFAVVILLIVSVLMAAVQASSVKLYTSKNYKNKCGEVSVGWITGHHYKNVPSACHNKVQSFQVDLSWDDSGVRLWSKYKEPGDVQCGGKEAGWTTEDWSRPSISPEWNKKINCIEFVG